MTKTMTDLQAARYTVEDLLAMNRDSDRRERERRAGAELTRLSIEDRREYLRRKSDKVAPDVIRRYREQPREDLPDLLETGLGR